MIHGKLPPRYIVNSRPGRGTCETIYEDNEGRVYREVSAAEAQMIESGTAPNKVYKLHSNGTLS